MIVDQSQPGAFAQVGMFAGGSVWTFLTSPVAVVLGPYQIAARELYSTGAVAGQPVTHGAAFADGELKGELFATGQTAGEVAE